MSIHRPETAPAPVPTTAPEPKRRLIPRPVRDAIELIATGRAKTIEAAAQRIGWERSRLSKWLSRPECIAAAKERAAKAVAVGRAAIRREIRRAGREREREGRNGGYEIQ